MKPTRNRIDALRNRRGADRTLSPAPVRRRSRRDTEAQHQRTFLLSMISIAAVIALILGGGAVYEYVIKPNQVLAEVNGHEIKRKDYWQYQSVALYNMARQYEAFGMQQQGQQQTQYLQLAASFDAQREDMWGSTDVSATTIQQMVDDRLYLSGAESLGITVTDEDLQTFSLSQYSAVDAPLMTPIPSPTMIPERATAAAQTADAMATEQAIAMGTIVPTPTIAPGSPVAGATPIGAMPVGGTPNVAATPAAGTPLATPVTGAPAEGTPVSSPVVAASPSATPNLVDSRRGAEAEFDIFRDRVFDDAHLNENQYINLWVRPQYVRQLVDARLTNEVPQTAEMVKAQHIVVGTEELANQLYEQATGGANFDELARSNSTDTTTSSTGGQLGWFTRTDVSPEIANVAFATEPGQVASPLQTGYGWELIKVIEKDSERPMSDAQYQQAVTQAREAWIEQQRANADISTDHTVEETPTPATFVPPPGAPTPILPTTVPSPTVPATPIIGPLPVTPGAATPVITGTPIAAGTPAASPAAAPVGSPVATPALSTPAG